MPRYFLDIHDAKGFHRDEAGDELEGLDEASDQCQAILSDLTRYELPDGDLHQVACEVRDGSGTVVYRGKLTYEGSRR